MNNTVAFPSVSSETRAPVDSVSSLSLAHRATALDICDLVYGPTIPSWTAIERFYEPNASYENPVVTATSRAVIADIHALASQVSQLDVPKPVALLHALFRISRDSGLENSRFKVLNMWNEVSDVSESESFDGHQKIIVEHTLHIDILPGILSSSDRRNAGPAHLFPSSESELPISLPQATLTHQATLRTRAHGGYNPPPSILKLSLPIMTSLSFNDAGKITHHRDFWDVKDLLSLLPGMSLAQWITTRLIAQSIRGIVSAGRLLSRSRPSQDAGTSDPRDEEEGLSPAAAYARTVKEHPSSTVL